MIIANEECYTVAENFRKARDIISILEFTAKLYLSQVNLVQLDQNEKSYLLNWESEKYRSSI